MNPNSENIDLISLWKSQEAKLDKVIQLNQELIKQNVDAKVKSSLSGLKSIRWLGIIFGIFWSIGIVLILVLAWSHSNWFFKAAFIIHLLSTVVAIGMYIYHLTLMEDFNNSQSVSNAQEQLAKLRNSNLKTLGVLWLQLPVFSMWFMSDAWMESNPFTFWYIQTPLVVLQAFIGLWLYRNLDMKNMDKKWFKWFISKGEFGKIAQAHDLLNQIKSIEK
jgi:hypothetical protein